MRVKTNKPELSQRARSRVEKATVDLIGSRGVLVPGEFILTATHCIKWSGSGGMALGEAYPTDIKTADGASFQLGVVACDPVSDITVLGKLDEQEFPDDADAFDAWREQIDPVPLSKQLLRPHKPRPVFIFTQKRDWISGTVTRYDSERLSPGSRVGLSAERIDSGMSGSPVVTQGGLLVGVVSYGDSHAGGAIPVAHLALPRWVLLRIES